MLALEDGLQKVRYLISQPLNKHSALAMVTDFLQWEKLLYPVSRNYLRLCNKEVLVSGLVTDFKLHNRWETDQVSLHHFLR